MNFKRSLKRPHVRPSSNNKEVADLLAVARFPIHGTKQPQQQPQQAPNYPPGYQQPQQPNQQQYQQQYQMIMQQMQQLVQQAYQLGYQYGVQVAQAGGFRAGLMDEDKKE